MRIMDSKLSKILEGAYDGRPPGREDCLYMLRLEETSLGASLIRGVANDIFRKNSENSAIILGQIGIDVAPCPGGCRFCTFGEDHTDFTTVHMSREEIKKKAEEFAGDGDLYALYLMAMHDYDLETVVEAVEASKEVVASSTQLWVNVGDSSVEAFEAFKDAGVTGVYHVCRINEGVDTKLDPEDRKRTMDNALKAGLELYTCCEPIGPEHTPEVLVENMFIGIEREIYQHAAMRRVAVPGSPLAKYGQISELRLAQIVAVIGLAALHVPTLAYLGVHEPNTISYISGANIITAESGVNPRDTSKDTAKSRGMDMQCCREMLWESGFHYLRRGDESKIPLTLEYIQEIEKKLK